MTVKPAFELVAARRPFAGKKRVPVPDQKEDRLAAALCVIDFRVILRLGSKTWHQVKTNEQPKFSQCGRIKYSTQDPPSDKKLVACDIKRNLNSRRGEDLANHLAKGEDAMSRSTNEVKRVKVILKDSELTCGDYNK